jgi:hypothetical protein
VTTCPSINLTAILAAPLASSAESLTESKEFMEFIVEEVLLRNEAVDQL